MYNEIFSYTIHFEAEAHPGSGLAIPGQADALVTRDADGEFCINEASIKGMIRDGAERLMLLLGSDRADARVIALFGKGSRNRRLQGVCSFPPAHLKAFSSLIRASVRYGNRVDREKGCVLEDFFFSRELLPVKVEFSGTVYAANQINSDEKHLLILAMKMVESFGAKRARGDGAALIKLKPEPKKEEIIEWLNNLRNEGNHEKEGGVER